MRRLAWLALFLLLSASALGCAWVRAAEARQVTMEREIARYVIQQALPEAWKIAISDDRTFWEVIAGRGLSWEETGRYQARSSVDQKTEKQTDGSFQVEKVWFDAEGVTAGDGSQIRFFRNTERHTLKDGQASLANQDRHRDLDMELAFIKKLDPKAGAEIDAEVKRAEDAARNE